MYKLSPVRSKSGDVVILVDEVTLVPLLYPMLYSLTKGVFQTFNTQLSNAHAIKEFYDFWQSKFGCSFCYSFYKAKTNPQVAIEELESFYDYLCNSSNIFNSEIAQRNFETVNKISNCVVSYLSYLNDEFVNSRYEHSTGVEMISLHNYISNRLRSFRKTFSSTLKRSKIIFGSSIQPSFDSMTSEMVYDLFSLLKPSTIKEENAINPFTNKKVQFRNFIIFRLLLNYGLRISELLLLEISSVKNTTRGRHALVITNASDNTDSRKRLSIKNIHSHRVLELTDTDYNLILTYIESVRPKSSNNTFLFISSKKPFRALDYQSIRFACSLLNKNFLKVYPNHFDRNNIDSIRHLHLHTFRHTWATLTLSALYKAKRAELIRSCKMSGVAFSEKGLMDEAKDELRKLGGWTVDSQIPNLYAARFIQEKANQSNIARINSGILD
uniref:Site-specific recombinase, phage integrase family n=1 Tax=Rheinheimera sp. BAL341 TaxID=1708203 RepID=A0A486XW65_9GAMM